MNNKLLPSILSLSALLFSSCIGLGPSIKGNGKVVEENRMVDPFSGIRVSRGMDVYISQDSIQKVVVQADENLLDAIETRVEDSNLVITVTENIREAKSRKVLISIKNLKEISAMAGSNVFTNETVRFNNLKLSSMAGSNLNLELITHSLLANAAAGSNILLKGKADNSEYKAMAGSNIKAGDFKTGKSVAKANTGSNIWLNVTSEINANTNSGGNIYYSGNPSTTVVKNSTGGNTIHK